MRRLPPVSDWASRFVEPEPDDVTYEEPKRQQPPSRPTLLELARIEQGRHRTSAAAHRSSSRWNFWSGLGCFALWWVPYHIGTALWVLSVIFWGLAFVQWMESLIDRRSARMYPDPDDLARF